MDSITVDDINVMEDPEGGCIVQADDPHMLAAAAFDGVLGSSGNNSWYWTSMLKLMEQGAVPSTSMSSTHNTTNNYTTGAHFTPGQQQATAHTPPPSVSSPSSSSVHDQPNIDMLAHNHAINANDPDSSVWGQEFLSGPIGENKSSNINNQLACTDDGLHELLYPRTVLELLFSDQLKLEQIPSWPDILQHSVSPSSAPGKSLGFPVLASDKIMAGAAHDNVSILESPQLIDIKFSAQYLHNYSHLSGMDDRLTSSTASSTISDNAIDQWAPTPVPGSSAAQCEPSQPHPLSMHSSPLSSNIQPIDHMRIKQEYVNHMPSPPFSNHHMPSPPFSGNGGCLHHQPAQNQRSLMGNGGYDEAMIINHEYEQKPNLLNKLWNPAQLVIASDPLSHINHKHNIYESITAAANNQLRQAAGLNPNAYNFQSVNNYNGVGDHARHCINIPAAHHYIHQPSQQLAKKSRPFHEGAGAASTGHAAADIEVKKEGEGADSKAAGDHHKKSTSTGSRGLSSPPKQQLSGTEYNYKRSRIEQQAPPPAPSPTTPATTAPPTPTNSSSLIKNQPVRKEKLSERITTLQQLVSPFGKTDTASVLLEAIGYIKFLQEQVQALSSPYFKGPTSQSGDRNHNGDEGKPDLRSRGLCLVPLSCTMQVANDNGADYWYGGAFR